MSSGARQDGPVGMPHPSDVVAGKYEIVRVLGQGGMGVVYEATHLRLQQRVALKMLLPEMLEHDVIVTRFEREARAAARLKSQHIARVLDVDVTPDGLPYLVMELLRGIDLHAELTRRRAIPPAEAVDIVLQACAAMAEAHQAGVVHRDLKPSNLFLADDGGEMTIKVLDFGISKLQGDGHEKLTGAGVIGTANYMSPEQIRASADVDGRADVWALGVILFEMLAGESPWAGTPTQIAAAIVTTDAPDLRSVPPELAAIVRRCLRRERDERFESVRDLALALAPFASGTGPARAALQTVSRTPGAGATARPARSVRVTGAARRRPSTLAVLAVSFVGGVVVLGGGLFAWMRVHDGATSRIAIEPSARVDDQGNVAVSASASAAPSSSPPPPPSPSPVASADAPSAPSSAPPAPSSAPQLASSRSSKPSPRAPSPKPSSSSSAPPPPAENPLTL